MENLSNLNQLIEVISKIPSSMLLEIAASIQKDLQFNPNLTQIKDQTEVLTFADLQIQKTLLEYLYNSKVKDLFFLKAEENIPEQIIRRQEKGQYSWQIIIDPIDGTAAYAKGEAAWGVMLGLCNQKGNLVYSWNLLSTGKIYSNDNISPTTIPDWASRNEAQDLTFDIFDYDSGLSLLIPACLQNKFTKANLTHHLNFQSSPSAIWAGWKLLQLKTAGLLWLPGTKGKRIYPDYDLCFLAVLAKQGWQIGLGKKNQKVGMLAIAPSIRGLEILWNCANSLLESAQRETYTLLLNELSITDSI